MDNIRGSINLTIPYEGLPNGNTYKKKRKSIASKRFRFEPDDLAKALCLINAMKLMYLERDIAVGLNFLFSNYPEAQSCTHEHLAELLCVARETITRAWPRVKRNGN